MKRRDPIIVDGVIHWCCTTCKSLLPEDGYYRDKRQANGLHSRCRKCHIESVMRTSNKANNRRLSREFQRRLRIAEPEKYRKRRREYRLKRPQCGKKQKARMKLFWAVRSGKMIRPDTCQGCGKIDIIEAHHRDYDLPFSVEWLCRECHGRKHWKENQHQLLEVNYD